VQTRARGCLRDRTRPASRRTVTVADADQIIGASELSTADESVSPDYQWDQRPGGSVRI
jgi:hypothetical protein